MENLDYVELRLKYGDLFTTTFRDYRYAVWRLMPYEEWCIFREIKTRLPNLAVDAEDDIFRRYVVETNITDEDTYECPGIVTSLAWVIYSYSGPTDSHELENRLNLARMETNTLEEMIMLAICAAFPDYRPIDLKKLSFNDLIKLAAKAEIVTGTPLQIRHPEDIAREQEEAKKRQKKVRQAPQVDAAKIIGAKPDVRTQEGLAANAAPIDPRVPDGSSEIFSALNKFSNGEIPVVDGPPVHPHEAGDYLTSQVTAQSKEERRAALKKSKRNK